jgi:hypothetical protein
MAAEIASDERGLWRTAKSWDRTTDARACCAGLGHRLLSPNPHRRVERNASVQRALKLQILIVLLWVASSRARLCISLARERSVAIWP